MIRNHKGAIFFSSLRHFASSQSLGTVMPSWWTTGTSSPGSSCTRTTLFEELSFLHVEAPWELVREFLKRAQLRFIGGSWATRLPVDLVTATVCSLSRKIDLYSFLDVFSRCCRFFLVSWLLSMLFEYFVSKVPVSIFHHLKILIWTFYVESSHSFTIEPKLYASSFSCLAFSWKEVWNIHRLKTE